MARRARIDLLINAAATSAAFDWPGGYGEVSVEGTFAGATLTLQKQSPNLTWQTVGAGSTFTANGMSGVLMAAGPIRMLVTGGPPSAVYAYITGIPTNQGG